VEISRIRYSILLSAAIQFALGAFMLHPYDGRVFFTTGYSVAHGNSPYVPADVSNIFGHTLFPETYPGIGYPPPWGLMLGVSYLLSYNLYPSLILYNIAVKVPIIAGNILLALLVGRIVRSETSNPAVSKNAIRFMLFNPYVIYTTAIWGQFDTLSTLLMLFAIYELGKGRQRLSAAALGGAIALKLIPVVLLPLLVQHVRTRGGWIRALLYFACTVIVVGVSFAPFLLGWSIKPIVDNWNVHFVRIGAFAPMYLLLILGFSSSTSEFSLLGYLWLPALAFVYCLVAKRRAVKSSDLMVSALAIVLGLVLTRSWVSEQNMNFVLPLVVLASVTLGWSRKWVTATWLLPLLFALLHSSPLGMFFLVTPKQFTDLIQVQLNSLLVSASFGILQPDIFETALTAIITVWVIVGIVLLRKSICAVKRSSQFADKTSQEPREAISYPVLG
jgi:hypothetical protein